MAKKKGSKVLVRLISKGSPHIYYTYKNKKNTTEKLVRRKYCNKLRQHIDFKEA